MSPDTRLQFSQCKPDQAPLHPEYILGMCSLGANASGLAWPVQAVLTPLLGAESTAEREYWYSSQPVRRGQFHDICFSRNDELLFGVITLDEQHVTASSGTALQCAAEQAYRQLFALLEAEGCRHLWRVWNYIPRINAIEQGLERYRQFNIGRHQAFSAFERPVDSSPAACALGVATGPLSIAFLAADHAAQGLENPRQISAFAYPRQYGPRSPTFSRAAMARQAGQDILFISGTASIVGHDTVHPGDVAAQTRETMANIAVLVAEANRHRPGSPFALAQLDYRVYIRHPADYPLVRQILEQQVGPALRASYVQADVCRDDLLVEIEAQAFSPD